MTNKMTVAVDWENNSEAFWDALRDRCETDERFPLALVPLCDTTTEATAPLADHEVTEVIDYCRELPGWGEGNRHAPHPLRLAHYEPEL